MILFLACFGLICWFVLFVFSLDCIGWMEWEPQTCFSGPAYAAYAQTKIWNGRSYSFAVDFAVVAFLLALSMRFLMLRASKTLQQRSF